MINNRIKIMFLMICLTVGIAGCKPMPSKEMSSVDQMKRIIKDGRAQNNSLKKIDKLPATIEDTLLVSVKTQGYQSYAKLPDSRFNITADGLEAQAFFLGLVEDTDINIIVHPDVSGAITLKLKNVTLAEVLDSVRRVYGFGYEETSEGVRIFPANMQTRSYRINYLNVTRTGSSETKVNSSGLNFDGGASSSDSENSDESSSSSGSTLNSKVNSSSTTNFWEELKETLELIIGNEDGRKVATSPMSGLVIVQALPNELLRVERFLEMAELSLNKQVIIEAKVLEVELNDAYRAGINWSYISNHLNFNQAGGDVLSSSQTATSLPLSISTTSGTSNVVDLSTGANNLAPTIASSATSYGGVLALGLNYKRLTSFVELLGSQGNVQVLSSPKVSTLNNQKALIKVGSDEFFATGVSTTTTVGGGGTAVTPTVEFEAFFTGIALDVTPQIGDQEDITLHIHPTVSTVVSDTKTVNLGTTLGTQTFPLAKSSIRESDTIVRARNGQLVIIGGLMQDKTEELVVGVPFLKEIPFLGKAFRQTRQKATKSELVILLRPMIVNDREWSKSLEETYERFDELDRGFHYGGNVDLYGTMGEKR